MWPIFQNDSRKRTLHESICLEAAVCIFGGLFRRNMISRNVRTAKCLLCVQRGNARIEREGRLHSDYNP